MRIAITLEPDEIPTSHKSRSNVKKMIFICMYEYET